MSDRAHRHHANHRKSGCNPTRHIADPSRYDFTPLKQAVFTEYAARTVSVKQSGGAEMPETANKLPLFMRRRA
jgi:hypothetical protein